jgi:hypothetical protein
MMVNAEQPDGRNPVDPNGKNPNGTPSNQSLPYDGMPKDELLSAYIDGELTDEQLASVQLRLEKDAAARQLVAELRELSQAVRSLPRHQMDQDIRQAVLRRAEREMLVGTLPTSPQGQADRATRPAATSRRNPRRWIWAGMAIAAALMLMVLQQPEENHPPQIAQAPAKIPPSVSALPQSESDRTEPPSAPPVERSHAPLKREKGGQMKSVAPRAAVQADNAVRGSEAASDQPAAEAQLPAHAMTTEDQLAVGAVASQIQAESADPMELPKSNAVRVNDQEVVVVHINFNQHTREASMGKFDSWLLQNDIQYTPAMAPANETHIRSQQNSKTAAPQSLPADMINAKSATSERRQGVEQIAVEALPQQLNGLLHACRNEANVETVVQSLRPDNSNLMPWGKRSAGNSHGFTQRGMDGTNRADSRLDIAPAKSIDKSAVAKSKRPSSVPDPVRALARGPATAGSNLPAGNAIQLPTSQLQIDQLQLRAGRDLGREFNFGMQSEKGGQGQNEEPSPSTHDQAISPPVQALFVLQWQEDGSSEEQVTESAEAQQE